MSRAQFEPEICVHKILSLRLSPPARQAAPPCRKRQCTKGQFLALARRRIAGFASCGRHAAHSLASSMLILATMPVEETKVITASSVSARIIATGIVIAFCYFASTILVTLLMAVLLAYFLDPVVTWMERGRIPRALGSLLMVLVTLALLAAMGWSLVERIDQFSRDWPKYRAPLRTVSADIRKAHGKPGGARFGNRAGRAAGARVYQSPIRIRCARRF